MAAGSESILFKGVTLYPEVYMQYKLHSVSFKKKIEAMKLGLGKGGQGWVCEKLGGGWGECDQKRQYSCILFSKN